MEKKIKTARIHCLSEVLSPLTHMMKTSGNEAIINREQVVYGDTVRYVPVLSGNAIRHRMIREPGAMYLTKQCGLYGKLTVDQANYLFNGGSLSESSVSENLTKIAAMQELLPLVRLLGGSLRNQVVGGSLIVQRGVLVCEENKDVIGKMLPEGYTLPEQSIFSSEHFVSEYQYTRGDAKKHKDAPEMIGESGEKSDSNLMIYTGQSIMPGSFFYHGFILQNVSMLEVGALLHALQQWDATSGTLGGQARIGHGKMKTSIFFEQGEDMHCGVDPAEAVLAYIKHVDENKDAIVQWLNETFPSKKKEAKLC